MNMSWKSQLHAGSNEVHQGESKRNVNQFPHLESLSSMLARKPPPWQVKNLFARASVCVLLGDSQVGKTFFALELSACVATGEAFLGREARQGAVVYLAAEGGAGMTRRLRALVGKHPDLNSAPIAFWSEAIDVRGSEDAMLTRIRDFETENGEVGLVVLDTLSQTIYGDENGQDMADYVRSATNLAREFGSPVLILHHVGKDAAKGARGNSSLKGNSDVIVSMTIDKKTGVRTATTDSARGGKMRDGEPTNLLFSLKTVDVGEDETSCILKAEGEFKVDKSSTKKPLIGDEQILIFDLAKQMACASLHAGKIDGPNSRPTFSRTDLQAAWVNAKKSTNQAAKTSPSNFTRALAHVMCAGHIEFDGVESDKLWLH